LIFDAHVHLPCYDDSLKTLDDKKMRLLNDLNENGVTGAIVIADSETTSPIGTTKECIELFSDTKNIFVMGGISPLIDYEIQLSQFEKYLSNKQIIACKLYPGHEAFYMDDSRLHCVLELCMKYDVPLAVHTGWENSQYNHPSYFAKIAWDNPTLRIVMCHVYYPDIDLCYDTTAAYPNIYYDISSLAHETENVEKTRNSLNRIARQNPQRIIFGTDYGMCSIQSHVDMIKSLDIDDDRKQLILSDNAITLYKLNIKTD
jgi:hypothetical protein